jgi:hypothetical protein
MPDHCFEATLSLELAGNLFERRVEILTGENSTYVILDFLVYKMEQN